MDRFPRSDSIVQARSGLQTYMAQVYGWMTVGLLLTKTGFQRIRGDDGSAENRLYPLSTR